MSILRDELNALQCPRDAHPGTYVKLLEEVLAIIDRHEAWVACDECDAKTSDLNAMVHHKAQAHAVTTEAINERPVRERLKAFVNWNFPQEGDLTTGQTLAITEAIDAQTATLANAARAIRDAIDAAKA